MRAVLCLFAVLPTLAFAEPDPAMVEVLDLCMTGPRDQADASACIGIITAQCIEGPGGQTTAGMASCAFSEAEGWDVLLNREYQAARAVARGMDADDMVDFPVYAVRADKLLAAQRAWIAFRDANCASDYAVWGAGTMRQIMGASCHLQMTAERAIALHDYYDEMQ
ncbi:MAG: DUF1311 domain-containing protein [Yoonia sp.]|nr:DUF1311 domain-containing protein [Yoonia sp.]